MLGILISLVVLFGGLGVFAYTALRTVAIAIPESAKGAERGSLVSAYRIAKYPAFLVTFLLSAVGLPEPVSSALRAIPRAIQWFNEGVGAKSGS